MKRRLLIGLVLLVAAALAAGWAWWAYELRWRPKVVDRHQLEIVRALESAGWVSPGDLDPSLEAALWKLAAGTVSEPVAGRGGLHIVQVVDRKEARTLGFAEVQEQLRVREQRRRMQDEVAVYMAELEQRSLIVAEPPPGAEGYRRLLGTRPPSEEERLGLREATNPPAVVEPGRPLPPPCPPGRRTRGLPARNWSCPARS